MTICERCKDFSTCKKICEKVSKILKDTCHSADWIRPKMSSTKRGKGSWREIPFSSMGKDWQDMILEDKNGLEE